VKPQLVFGTGSARCGSKSLAVLFGGQERVAITHERFLLPWTPNLGLLRAAVELAADEPARQVVTQGEPVRWMRFDVPQAAIVGDISPCYASYAPWLISQYGARIVCLKRDKAATVDSFLRQRFDHCSLHPSATDRPLEEDLQTTPKFDLSTRRAAAEAYWDFFYAHCERMQELHPDGFRIWPIDALNSDEAQNEILAFAGIEGGRNIHVDSRYTKYACALFGGNGGNMEARC